jgi:PAS domain S-box-containing protein
MVLKKEITLQIKELLQKNPQGLSITDIVKEININRNTAGRYLENLLVSGHVDMRRLGMAKIYMISQRVPVSAVLSISSELVIQLDSSLRIVFVNEPFLKLVGTDSKNLQGKNIEYTPVPRIFDEFFSEFLENIREGITGREWSGEIALTSKDVILFCQIAPTVFDDGRKGVSVILEDITKRKQAEQKVEDSERQFRLLAENSLDMIGRIKPDFTHTYASPAYTTTLGYLPEEIVGKPARLFVHPDDVHIMEAAKNYLTEQNSSARMRFRARHKDGHYLWIESHVRGIIDEKTHEVSEYYTVTRDISERKKAEEALQESEMRYRSLVETTGTGYVIIDKDGRVITANPEYVRLTGRRSLAEIEGRSLIDWTAPYDRERNAREIEQCFRKGQVRDLEIDYQRPDGTIQPIEINASVIQSGSGGIILTLCRDITQRRQDEKTLKESEDRYRKLVEISPDAVFLHRDGKIIYANPATFTLLGATRPDEIIGKNVLDFVSPEFRDIVRENIQKDLRGKVSPQTELRMVRIDGTPIIIEGRGIATETDGKPAVQVAIREITDQNGRKKR